ncbi:MAG: GNAT family N-acetyltransferase [Bdellovibrio sp.]
MFIKTLPSGLIIKEVSAEEYHSMLQPHFSRTFSNRVNDYRPVEIDMESKKRISERNKVSKFHLRLVVLLNNELVGWHTGYEQNAETYYMQNSAVLEKYRNQKIYSQLLDVVLDRIQSEGFQVVLSTHHPHNSAVLIPKLRRGFFIAGMHFDERFRSLVELKYLFNEERRKNYFKSLGLEL